jgi:hypothetical protein
MIPEQRPIQISVRSDAATETLGWGGTLQREGITPLCARGYFTKKEQALHINALELLLRMLVYDSVVTSFVDTPV